MVLTEVTNNVTENEVEELQRETEALKDIRSSLGSDEFSRKVFDKVFKDDIERLKKVEDLWKERQQPESLEFEKIKEDSASVDPAIASTDQRVWTLVEDFTVFEDG